MTKHLLPYTIILLEYLLMVVLFHKHANSQKNSLMEIHIMKLTLFQKYLCEWNETAAAKHGRVWL